MQLKRRREDPPGPPRSREPSPPAARNREGSPLRSRPRMEASPQAPIEVPKSPQAPPGELKSRATRRAEKYGDPRPLCWYFQQVCRPRPPPKFRVSLQ
eukprot:210007-Prorocentrum_minimum.AAC.1